FSFAMSGTRLRFRAGAQHGGRGDVLDRQAAAGRDLLRAVQALQRRHGGVHDVQRVGRAERLAEHVVDAGALQHGADRTAGDHTGTRGGRAQQDDAGGVLTLHLVRDGALDARDAEEVLLRLLDALGDGGRNFLGLAVTHAHHAVAVADDDQRGEAEPPAALDDLGDPVDGHDLLDVGDTLVCGAAAAIVTAVTPLATGAAPRSCSHQWFLFPSISMLRTEFVTLELQPAGARTLGEGGDAAVVPVAAAVEDDGAATGVLGALSDQLADLLRLLGLGALRRAQRGVQGGGGHQGVALGVVHDLGDDVLGGAGDHQARTRLGAGDLLADPQVPAGPGGRARGGALADRGRALRHAYLPAFPALERICSPWYRTPFFLYGSGLRRPRMFAATWPTSCLSIPSTCSRVGFSTRKVMPSGGSTTTGWL